MKTAIIAFILMGCAIPLAVAENIDSSGYSVEMERLLDAVYKAEGGVKAKPAYGVVSWPACGDVGACRYFASEIVRVHHARWVKAGSRGEFIDYLGSKYAPIEAHRLNANWVRNVKYHYQHNKRSA